jgi:hypothetical protein
MRRRVQVAVVLLLLVLAAGVGVVAVGRVRQAVNLTLCQYNLYQVGLALHDYHGVHGHFPSGTVANPRLPPERRLSWAVRLWPTHLEAGGGTPLDMAEAWDAAENRPPGWGVWAFCCPSDPTRVGRRCPAPRATSGWRGWGTTPPACRSPTPGPGSSGTTGWSGRGTSRTARGRRWR